MKINKFYLVLKPTSVSELQDICFECDAERFILQSSGGLKPDRIHGLYTSQKEAEEIAKSLLYCKKFSLNQE